MKIEILVPKDLRISQKKFQTSPSQKSKHLKTSLLVQKYYVSLFYQFLSNMNEWTWVSFQPKH